MPLTVPRSRHPTSRQPPAAGASICRWPALLYSIWRNHRNTLLPRPFSPGATGRCGSPTSGEPGVHSRWSVCSWYGVRRESWSTSVTRPRCAAAVRDRIRSCLAIAGRPSRSPLRFGTVDTWGCDGGRASGATGTGWSSSRRGRKGAWPLASLRSCPRTTRPSNRRPPRWECRWRSSSPWNANPYRPGLRLGSRHWGHVPGCPVLGLSGSTRCVTSTRSGSSDAV